MSSLIIAGKLLMLLPSIRGFHSRLINPLGLIPDVNLFNFEVGGRGQWERRLDSSNLLLRRRFRWRDALRRVHFHLHSCSQLMQSPLDKFRLVAPFLCQREAYRYHTILLLDEAAQRLHAGDFGGHNEWLGDDLQREGLLAPQQSHAARLLQPFNLNLADGIGDPFRGAGFRGLEKTFVAGCESIASASL